MNEAFLDRIRLLSVGIDPDMTQRDGTKLVPISAEIEADLREDLKRLAVEGDRSFSAEVRRALRWYVISEAAAGRPAA